MFVFLNRRMFAAIFASTAVLLLASCGSSDNHTTAADHNAADITFASKMIPHHQQAVEMAGQAQNRSANPKVKAIAQRIQEAQGPEITQMSKWLKSWGQAVPSMVSGHEGHGAMTGMMSEQEMSELAGANGATFDQMFLQMMIRHHEGAIEMAQTQQRNGENPDAKKLATAIETAQAAEITEMKKLQQGE